jgi:hypothetical protein
MTESTRVSTVEDRLARWASAQSAAILVLVTSAAALLIRAAVAPVVRLSDLYLAPRSGGPMVEASAAKMIVLGILVAPIVETLLGQSAVFAVAHRIGLYPQRRKTTIAVSGLLFGGMHTYGLGYAIGAVAVGVVLATAYAVLGASRRAYWTVVVSHALLNVVAAVNQYLQQ